MPGFPAYPFARCFIFDETPWHGIAEGAHPVLLYIVAAQVHQCQVHETPYGHVGSFVYLALAIVYAQLSGKRTVQPAVGNPGMGACKCAAEVR